MAVDCYSNSKMSGGRLGLLRLWFLHEDEILRNFADCFSATDVILVQLLLIEEVHLQQLHITQLEDYLKINVLSYYFIPMVQLYDYCYFNRFVFAEQKTFIEKDIVVFQQFKRCFKKQ
jgi:hypothetical protein